MENLNPIKASKNSSGDLRFACNMNGFTLIVAEKPDAAFRIASALDVRERPTKMYDHDMPYYVADCEGKIVVVPALGHMYTITGRKERSIPEFTFRWVPRYIVDKKATRVRRWIKAIGELAENADSFVDACDYDMEGCIIGYFILKDACKNKEHQAKRMKYSTLTKEELKRAYENLLPHLDFNLIEAGLTRHEVDWLYGINLSRILTNAAKKANGRYAVLSTGRVQGPTLKFLVEREKAISRFVPVPYWQVKAQIELNGQILDARCAKEQIFYKEEAEAIKRSCDGKQGLVEAVKASQTQLAPPVPFDLGLLQSEAYRIFKYSPSYTSSIAQKLYVKTLISYPRTGSQKLPPSIGFRTILENLSKYEDYRKLASELLAHSFLKPKEGRKEDPAHPAIYPTGNIPGKDLIAPENRIWNLIVRRFMSAFGAPAVKRDVRVSIAIGSQRFHLTGQSMIAKGWIQFSGRYTSFREVSLPPVQKGQTVTVRKITLHDRFTEPPPRYNPSTLLEAMEKAEIGTKATRAEITQTLCDRRYVEGERMVVTDLGSEVLETLQNYCPTIVSTSLTRELEAKMNAIQEKKCRREEVLAEVVKILAPILKNLKEQEKAVGEKLSHALEKMRMKESAVGPCPVCKSGTLVIIRSKKTGKRFVGCSNYFDGRCNTSFPLPQKGVVKSTNHKCRNCGWPIVQVRTSRRQWTLCLNPTCSLNKP